MNDKTKILIRCRHCGYFDDMNKFKIRISFGIFLADVQIFKFMFVHECPTEDCGGRGPALLFEMPAQC